MVILRLEQRLPVQRHLPVGLRREQHVTVCFGVARYAIDGVERDETADASCGHGFATKKSLAFLPKKAPGRTCQAKR